MFAKKMTKSSEDISPSKSGKKQLIDSQMKLIKSPKFPAELSNKSMKTNVSKEFKRMVEFGDKFKNKRAYLDKVHNSHHLVVPAKIKEVRHHRKHTREDTQPERSAKVIVEPSEEVYGPQTEDELECTRQGTANFREGQSSPQVQHTWRPMDQEDRESEANQRDPPIVHYFDSEPVFKVYKNRTRHIDVENPKQPVWYRENVREDEYLPASPDSRSNRKAEVMLTNEKEKSLSTLWMSGSRLHLPINPLLEARDKIKQIMERTTTDLAFASPNLKASYASREYIHSDNRGQEKIRISNCHSIRGKLNLDISQNKQRQFNSSFRSSYKQSENPPRRSGPDSSGSRLFSRRGDLKKPVKQSMAKCEILKILKLHKQLQSRVSVLADKFKSEHTF